MPKHFETRVLPYSSEEIFNLVRAVTKPYPGAFTFTKTQKIIVWNAFPFDNSIKYSYFKNGQVVEKFFKGHLVHFRCVS